MQSALSQVRTLALRTTTPNQVLLASVEHLYDLASASSHKDTEIYKMALKACRENEGAGRLHSLVTKLLGTDAAKKTQTAIDQWHKVAKKEKEGEKKKEDQGSSYPVMPGQSVPSYPVMPGQSVPSYPVMPGPSPWFYPYQRPSRGRGRGGRPMGPRTCFICKSTDHMVSGCPHNTFTKDK